MRTATSDTFQQSDGSRLTRIAAHPINYRHGAKWEPIDSRLSRTPTGLQPIAMPVPLSFPLQLGQSPVVVGSNARRLEFTLVGADATAVPRGARAEYKQALKGVTTRDVATANGIKETLTLTSRAAPSVFRYKLGLAEGLRAALTAGGSIAITNAAHQKIYTIAAPSARDSSTGAQIPQTAPVRYALSPDGRTLALKVAKRWLASPARVFPVQIDPDVYFGSQQGCTIASGSLADSELCGGPLYVGHNGEGVTSRALLKYDLTEVPRNAAILQSSIAMWLKSTENSTPIELDAYGLTSGFDGNVTWNDNESGHAWGTPGGDAEPNRAGAFLIKPEYAGGWTSVGFSQLVEKWVRDPSSNYGVLLRAHSETTHAVDEFIQTDNGEGAPEPDINIVWEPRMGGAEYQPYVADAIGGGGTLSVDPENGDLKVVAPDVVSETSEYRTAIERVYNSLDDELVGSEIGGGWRLNLGQDTLLYPAWWDGSNVFHEPGGGSLRFDRDPEHDGTPEAGDEAFTAAEGAPEKLVLHENDTRTLTYENSGIEYRFDNSENGFPQEIYDPAGAGNTVSLGYTESKLTEVRDSHGHKYTLSLNGYHQLATVEETTSGEKWSYSYNPSHQLTKVTGPSGREEEYDYGPTGQISGIVDASGTYVIEYDEEYRVKSIRHIVNGTLETVGSEDEVTTMHYEAPTEEKCTPGSDVAQTTVVFTPGENEAETFCYDAAGEITGYWGREGEATEENPDEEGEPSHHSELKFTPDGGGAATVKPAAVTSKHYHLYTPSKPEAVFVDEIAGTFVGRAKFSGERRFIWSFQLSAENQSQATGPVSEKADAYTLPRGRKINYSDHHASVSPDYLFHSSFMVALNQEYQLAINLDFPCEIDGVEGLCEVRVRDEFELKRPSSS